MRLMLALLASLLLGAAPGQVLELQEGVLTYTLIHKLHQVEGTSRALEGKAMAAPDGTMRVQVRTKIASFDSGNSNRDEHMREVTHEAMHPYVTVKGTLPALSLPLAAPLSTTLHATVELNGEKQPAEIPVQLTQDGPRVRAKLAFPISLEAFKIERPELLFVKVDDRVVLRGEIVFVEAK
jgi:hypothetical protein